MDAVPGSRSLALWLRSWLPAQRWYAGKARTLLGLVPYARAELSRDPPVDLVLMRLLYSDESSDMYLLHVLSTPEGGFRDALENPECQRMLLRLLAENVSRGPFRFESYAGVTEAEPRLLRVEQSNTSIAYGAHWILKSFRRVVFGASRDLEVGRFLTEQTPFAHTPQVVGAISYEGNEEATLGVLQRFVENHGDCWGYVLSQLQPPPNPPDDVFWAQDGLPDRSEALLAQIERLGQVTGEMHRALASRPDIADFAPEPAEPVDRDAWLADAQAQLASAEAAARHARLSAFVDAVAGYRETIERLAADLPVEKVQKIQIHGDYHLGQVLKTAGGFTIIDFEGEPSRPLHERRAKQPALRDVAGMLRSLDYAAAFAGVDGWSKAAGERFLAGWRSTSGLEADPRLLVFFQLTKAFYELSYELNHRPNWAHVPLRGIQALMAHA